MRSFAPISAVCLLVVACGVRFRLAEESDGVPMGGGAAGGNDTIATGGGGVGGDVTSTEDCGNDVDDDGDGAVDCDDSDCKVQCTADAYVDDDAPAGGDGSFDSPFNEIADAVQLCDGAPKTIFVYAGSYAGFDLPPSCLVVGESTRSVVVDGNGARSVRVADGGTPAAGLRRLTLSQGTSPGGDGGCLVLFNGELEVAEVVMTACSAARGGALHVRGGLLTATDIEIADSSATNGAGIAVTGGELDAIRATVRNNAAADRGGGVYVADGGAATFTDASIGPNNTGANGGALHQRGANSFLALIRLRIWENSATARGGGIFHDNGPLEIENSYVVDNSANEQSGGIHQKNGGTLFTHVTIAGNSAPNFPAGICCEGGSGAHRNMLIWGNPGGGSHNCPLSTSSIQENPCCGNTSLDPLFVDAANSNYHLSSVSPVIGYGDPTTSTTIDFDGDQRDSMPDVGADEVPQ